MTRPASLFISHGSPDLILHNTSAKKFLESASEAFDKPKGIIIASAHFERSSPTVVSDRAPSMIYDFRGFDNRLMEIIYPAPGNEALAQDVMKLLSKADIEHEEISERGYDHGTWVPLSLLYPEADLPIVQLSVQPDADARHHYELGVALRPLVDDDILFIGSGAITHNLGALFSPHGILHQREDDEIEWARQFADWMAEKVDEGETGALIDFYEQAPFAHENHPTSEHILPLFVALGASQKGAGERLHKSTEFAILAMDAFAFH